MMRRPLASARGAARGLALLGFAALAAPAPSAAEAGSPVRIVVESPLPGSTFENRVHQAPIRGSAVADGERPADFDVMLVIDVSQSTREPSGADVDGDGDLGFDPQLELVEPGKYADDVRCTDPDDSILHAEVVAATALLDTLESDRVRVGVVSFAGEMDAMK